MPTHEGSTMISARRTRRRWSVGVATIATMILTTSLLTSCDSRPPILEGTVTVQSVVGVGSGTATSASGGSTPSYATGAVVTVFANNAVTPVASTTTNLVGQFGFSASTLTGGTYRLRVNDTWWGGIDWATATPVTVSAGNPSTVDVQLTAVGTIPGTVVDTTRTGVSGVPVWATDAGGATVAATVTGTSGAFTLGVAEPGEYTVHLLDAAGVVDIGGDSPVVFPVYYPEVQNSAGWIDLATGEQYRLDHVEAIDSGGATCALLTNGTVQCWGYNVDGALGNGTFDNVSAAPVLVTGISDAVAIATGEKHTCAVHRTGAVSCWGFNEDGELGHGDALREPTPVTVNGIDDAIAVAAGGFHTCALRRGGTISCWGYNHSGELGDGTTTSTNTPVTVTGIGDAVAITAGRYHTCAVHASGTVSCWGSNDYGAIGNGTDHNYFTTPVAVSGVTDATAVDGGEYHTCALRTDHTVSCWGANFNGALGDGTYNDSNVPVAVHGISDATAIAMGAYQSYALHADGTVSVWGGFATYLGGDDPGVDSNVPISVLGVDDAVALSNDPCVVHADTTVSCNGSSGTGSSGAAGPLFRTVIAGVLD